MKINPKLSKKRIINVLNIWENNLLKENEEKGKIENIYSSTFDL